MVLLVMPEWAKAVDAEDFEVDSWEASTRRQLSYSQETWETVDEGDILAVSRRLLLPLAWQQTIRGSHGLGSGRAV